ncbi:MAG: hypothetical protein ACI9HK_006218, partial [Pirellulaceae bacterium]
MLALLALLAPLSGCFRTQPNVSGTPGTANNSTASSPTNNLATLTNADDRIGNIPQTKAAWDEVLQGTWSHIRQSDFAEAAKGISKLKAMKIDLTAAQSAELAAADIELNRKKELAFNGQQGVLLRKVIADIDRGELDGASERLNEVLSNAPSAEQRAEAVRLKAIVDEQVAVLQRTNNAVEALASDNRDEVLKAQNQMFEDVENALAFLAITSKSENPVLVRNSLETLGKLQRPAAALPIMLAVLERSAQQPSWNDAVDQIELLGSAGAGESLLQMALSTPDPVQREVALRCLSKVPDPPARTFISMLPLIQEDG